MSSGQCSRSALSRDSVCAQDDEFLYLVMEYLPGGDVMVRLNCVCLPVPAVQCHMHYAVSAVGPAACARVLRAHVVRRRC